MSDFGKAIRLKGLVLGGSRSGSDEDALNPVRGIIGAGTASVFFGRNIFQADNMADLVQRVSRDTES